MQYHFIEPNLWWIGVFKHRVFPLFGYDHLGFRLFHCYKEALILLAIWGSTCRHRALTMCARSVYVPWTTVFRDLRTVSIVSIWIAWQSGQRFVVHLCRTFAEGLTGFEFLQLRLSCPSCRAAFCAVYTYKLVEGKPILHKVQKMEPPKEEEVSDFGGNLCIG